MAPIIAFWSAYNIVTTIVVYGPIVCKVILFCGNVENYRGEQCRIKYFFFFFVFCILIWKRMGYLQCY